MTILRSDLREKPARITMATVIHTITIKFHASIGIDGYIMLHIYIYILYTVYIGKNVLNQGME